MLQSHLFIPTRKQPPADEPSKNGQLLAQAGYVDRLHAGAYSWLPLGLMVLNRVANVVREEHAAIGAQEVLLPALQVPGVWEETGRWESLGKEVMYQWKDQSGHPFGLATTHEEVMVDLVRRGVQSYRDLPQALYQIQWKFRNEARAKSGVIRGREFLMKDLYSFNVDANAHAAYYQTVQEAYKRIFLRFGLNALVTEASGGSFTKQHSHEFQVPSDAGEDRILTCAACGYAQNVELGESNQCPSCKAEAKIVKSIEVGNTFNFGNTYGDSMKLTAVDTQGKPQPLYVASYGIGISRLVGTLAEVFADEKG
ncbi:MAG: aminoacyl--tRNA ligase-related protein, partial [Patescibacteria group bacterium]